MVKPKVFISFDFDNDQCLRDLLVGQAKNWETPFDIEDWSVKEAWVQSEWKDRCRTKMKRCDFVIVMCGKQTSKCSGIRTEIKIANDLHLPVYWIKWYNENCEIPDGLDWYYEWTWKNLKYLTENYKKDVKPPFERL